MTLAAAHEGYEYQDLLTCYFILNEIAGDYHSEFSIDRKEFKGDKIDDLLISRNGIKYKKQIKYSNDNTNHTLSKSDLSSDGIYQLSIDTLYNTWINNPEKDTSEFRLCLSWQEPTDDLINILKLVPDKGTFANFPTKVFMIDGNVLWPDNSQPISTWRRFSAAAKTIDRNKFLVFCDRLLIEVLMPKLSLDLNSPGDLEKIVIEQVRDLGIGIYPNDESKPENFILGLLAIIKRSRSKGTAITTSSVFHELNIVTNYGSIEQIFPILQAENIKRISTAESFLSDIAPFQKNLLVDEPGSGKSWFIENLINLLKKKKVQVVRHLCYTDLNDPLQRERIRLNVFYGNLISDLITAYPDLKKFKRQKFASNLSELNYLLENIDKQTYLIIDGLDHIDRIATFRGYSDVTDNEIAIIESIGKLKISQNLKILIASQNIGRLELFHDFEKRSLPKWTEPDIKKMMKIVGVPNNKLTNGSKTSDVLIRKSAGNPLYLRYLLGEFKKQQSHDLLSLSNLPDYSFNLSSYYSYLLSQLNMREEVPQILSGVSFSLSQIELEEITHSGDHVSESLQILSPVLKLNISQSGYSIYHESFRRYIIDFLKSKNISLEHKIFNPTIEWFESKDFFSYQKAYRFYMQFLYDGGLFTKIMPHLTHTFVTDSVINGQPWELIEKNYKYFVKAACKEKDFPSIVLLNELNKIIGTCQNHFSEIYTLYLDTLGKIYGFKHVSEYLLFEGNPTLPYREGLKACYVCDENRVTAPWHAYMEYFQPGKSIEREDFKYFVRGLLVAKDHRRLEKMAKILAKDFDSYYCDVFVNELDCYSRNCSSEFVHHLSSQSASIHKIMSRSKIASENRYSISDVQRLADLILDIDSVHTKETELVIEFFNAFKSVSLEKGTLAEDLINKFKSKNWFYNWLIYYIKVISIQNSHNYSYNNLKEAFQYLKYSTEPFLGKPRACDLYSLQPFIYQSFEQGLSFLQTDIQWKETIDTLVLVSNRTTTSLQRSINGPLATDKLFQLLSDHTCKENISHINEAFESLVNDKQEYHLHLDIAEYNFRLASISVATSGKQKALEYFRKGVEFSLAYTMRKDLTLMDVIDGVEHISKINPNKNSEYLKTARMLVDSAVSHTDGKETHHFPVLWFERFLDIDKKNASLFLLNELKDYRFHWVAESALIDLLSIANGKINPEIECFLALTLPVADSEKFVKYCLTLYEKLKVSNAILGDRLMVRIISSMQPMQNRHRSPDTIINFNSKLQERFPTIKTVPQKVPYQANSKHIPWFNDIRERQDLSRMSSEELIMYFDSNSILRRDLISLSYFFDENKELSDFNKEIIYLIVSKNARGFDDKIDLDLTFQTGDDIECYYWVCRFVSDHGGWFEKFINQNAFLKAHTISREKAFVFLFELLPFHLNVGFNSSFSSNLINLLVTLGYDISTTQDCWENLLKITSYRLPIQEDIEWENIFNYDMDDEEILLSILICRLRAGTTERYQWVTTGLDYLISVDSNKLIKPIKWFLQHKRKFLKTAETIILQLIYKQASTVKYYELNFRDELLGDFPTRYFLSDYIIGQLYDRPLNPLTIPKGIVYPQISEDEFNFFYYLNRRFKIFEINGIDLNHCFNKYSATFNEKYQDYFELYQNRVYKRTVPHVLSAEHMAEIMNTDNYEEFANWSDFEYQKEFELGIFIDIDSIVLQTNAFTLRPMDLIKPSEMPNAITKRDQFDEEEWIRLGHYETELKKTDFSKTTSFKTFGGVTFATPVKNTFPYSAYTLFPFQLWWEKDMQLDLDENIVVSVLYQDSLETLKLLWLNPRIVSMLGLKTKRTFEGLIAQDLSGNVVLKMRTWSGDHIGDGHRSSLYDEIPTLNGTDLMIKSDYFKKLCAIFENSPTYLTTRIENAFI